MYLFFFTIFSQATSILIHKLEISVIENPAGFLALVKSSVILRPGRFFRAICRNNLVGDTICTVHTNSPAAGLYIGSISGMSPHLLNR